MRSRTNPATVTRTGDAPLAEDVLPEAYHQSLFPPVPEPSFETAEELERVWGARWGANSEVGRLQSVLVRPPGAELGRIRAEGWDPAIRALVDPEEGWYWAVSYTHLTLPTTPYV